MTAQDAKDLVKNAPNVYFHKLIDNIKKEATKGKSYLIDQEKELTLKNKENLEALGFKLEYELESNFVTIIWE